ncbi:extracellular solute-binding protein [Natronolimnobius sp. AArcel1]|uniref:extracellular solute-binding protein n=1 Tax=Natronolimnobius sp. AArcel1 TaxID=1679093 RepID=UPI0013ECD448|nr:extracellular solute-binding protein [Natronolimnobius sp. AArcel1]NGM70990.1 extracellular solute-binding protein [Natronolimnobius sp. AArcel1]
MDSRDWHSAGRWSRRAVLAGAAGTAVGSTAGCLADSDRVRVLAAGSLAVALETDLGRAFHDQTGIALEGEYHGSNVVMRMVEDASAHPDVVISADVSLLRDRLIPEYTSWDLSFAANEVGIAYEPETDLGERLAAGEPWYEVFADAETNEIAISDPDLDPLGYRAVHLFELAEREYDLEGFREQLLERTYWEPDEPQLLAGIEAGDRACAVAYRNMAADHGLPFLELPDAYNFGNPAYDDHYADASYTTDDGYETRGSSTVYNATVPEAADRPDAGREFISFLASNPTILREQGLRVDETFPQPNGSVPAEVRL